MAAAVSVMGEVGDDGASVRAMAERAGVTSAALYHHFDSKEALLRDFLDAAWRQFVAHVERNVVDIPSGGFARLDALVRALVTAQGHDRYARLACNVAARDYARLAPTDRRSIAAHHRRLRSIVEEVVDDGRAAGAFSVADARIGATAIMLLARELRSQLAAEGRSHEEIVETVTAFARAIVQC